MNVQNGMCNNSGISNNAVPTLQAQASISNFGNTFFNNQQRNNSNIGTNGFTKN